MLKFEQNMKSARRRMVRDRYRALPKPRVRYAEYKSRPAPRVPPAMVWSWLQRMADALNARCGVEHAHVSARGFKRLVEIYAKRRSAHISRKKKTVRTVLSV